MRLPDERMMTATTRIVMLLIASALPGCATAPTSQLLDARATCQFIVSRLGAEEPNHRHRRFLRLRQHRPRRRAPEPRDERTPPHP